MEVVLKNKMSKRIILSTIAIILIIILSFSLGRSIGIGTHHPDPIIKEKTFRAEFNEKFPGREVPSQNGLFINCSNLDLEDTAYCLNYYSNRIFNYTLTDDSRLLSDYELKTRGGDCLDYSRFMEIEFQTYGFRTLIPKIDVIPPMVENGIAIEYGEHHVFLIVNDKTGYCLMDMTQYKCYNYEEIVTRKL